MQPIACSSSSYSSLQLLCLVPLLPAICKTVICQKKNAENDRCHLLEMHMMVGVSLTNKHSVSCDCSIIEVHLAELTLLT